MKPRSDTPRMEDHREFVSFDPETMTATCSLCSKLIDISGDIPEISGGDKWANHSFGHGIEITGVGITQHDERLAPFEDFMEEME